MRTAYGFGSDVRLLGHYARFLDNSENWSHSVGQLRPSLRGLFDTHGNLFEWCHDWYAEDLSDNATDPIGAETGSDRVFRGGCWGYPSLFCRSAFRGWHQPGFRDGILGFRVATTVPPANPASPASDAESDSR